MKQIITTLALVGLTMPVALAAANTDVVGYATGSAKNRTEWVKADASCLKAGIGKSHLVLRCNSNAKEAFMDIDYRMKPTKGFKQVDVYVREGAEKGAMIQIGLTFDLGAHGTKGQMFKGDELKIVQEGAYSKITVDKSKLYFSNEDHPIKQVIVSFNSDDSKNPKGAELGATYVTAGGGIIAPSDMDMTIHPGSPELGNSNTPKAH